MVTVSWADGSSLTRERRRQDPELHVRPIGGRRVRPSTASSATENGDKADDLTGRDGTILDRSDPAFATKLYSQFGNSWRIKPVRVAVRLPARREHRDVHGPGHPVRTGDGRLDPGGRQGHRAGDLPGRRCPVRTASRRLPHRCRDDRRRLVRRRDRGRRRRRRPRARAGGRRIRSGTGRVDRPEVTSLPPTQVGSIAMGQTVTGSIAAPTDSTDYTFTGAAGEVVYLQAHDSPAPGPSAGTSSPRVAGISVAASCAATSSARCCRPKARTPSGSTAIRTRRAPTRFTVLAVPADGRDTNDGRWDDRRVADDGRPAGRLHVQRDDRLRSSTSSTGRPARRGSSWELRSPSGGSLASTGSCIDLARMPLPATGTYTIRFSGDHVTTGPYSFTLLAVPATVVAPITLGQTVSGALTSPGQQADYMFSRHDRRDQIHAARPRRLRRWPGLAAPRTRRRPRRLHASPATTSALTRSRPRGPTRSGCSGDRTSTGAYSFTLQPGG